MAGKTTGVYQLSNGLWAFRYTVSMNGKKKDVKKTKDESGKPFKTEKRHSEPENPLLHENCTAERANRKFRV